MGRGSLGRVRSKNERVRKKKARDKAKAERARDARRSGSSPS